jgi:hypothetical protein
MSYEYIHYIKRGVIRQKRRGFVNESGFGTFEFAELLVANPPRDSEAGSKGSHLSWNLNTFAFQHQY